MKRIKKNSSKTTGAEIDNAMTFSMAEEARNAPSVGDNRACSNKGSRKKEYNNSVATVESRVGATQPIYYRDRQGEKLLHLWRI